MGTFRWRSGLLTVGAVIAITACREKVIPTPEPAREVKIAQQAVARAQDSLREMSDVYVKQLALDNSLTNDPAITEAIRQYEALSASERVKFIVGDNDRKEGPTWTRPAPRETKNGGFPLENAGTLDEKAFDLAMRTTDVYAKQVRLTNELFKDADAATLAAVDAWEKMTPDQRRSFSATPEATAYYWRYVYVTYKLQLLRYYYLYTRQCYWGYKTPAAIDIRASLGDKQFDLKRGSTR